MHSKNLRNSVERSPVLHILSCIVWRLAYPANNKPKSSHRNKKKHNDPISVITCLASPSTSALHHTITPPHYHTLPDTSLIFLPPHLLASLSVTCTFSRGRITTPRGLSRLHHFRSLSYFLLDFFLAYFFVAGRGYVGGNRWEERVW